MDHCWYNHLHKYCIFDRYYFWKGGHRPLDGGFNSTELENLFLKYGVAMYFAGLSWFLCFNVLSYVNIRPLSFILAISCTRSPRNNTHRWYACQVSFFFNNNYWSIVGGAGCEEMVFAEDNPTPGYHVGMIIYLLCLDSFFKFFIVRGNVWRVVYEIDSRGAKEQTKCVSRCRIFHRCVRYREADRW